MSRRFLIPLSVLAIVAMMTLTPVSVSAQTQAEGWTAPQRRGSAGPAGRVGLPTITPMQRPSALAGKEVLTEEEAAELEIETLSDRAGRDEELPFDTVGNYNQFWFDPGTTVVDTRRTSLVVDPPDGRIPPLTPEADERRSAGTEQRRGLRRHTPTPGGFVEDLGPGGVQVRCILGFNSGPPMTPGGYNQNVQLFQTPDYVVLLNEMIHNARIVPLDGRPRLAIPQWAGDSRAHWEGDTLVVETTNFLRETAFQGGLTGPRFRLVERFTRLSPNTLIYEATIEDPAVWTRPWTYQIPMSKSEHPMYEYACHEGNYGLYNILAGAQTNPKANVLEAEEAEEEAARRRR